MTRRWAAAGVVALCVLAVLIGGGVIVAGSRSNAPDAAAPPGNTAPGGPVVAFYGDSYTLGTGASDPSRRWTTIICAERRWNEVNPSVNGLGFVNNRDRLPAGGDLVDAVIASEPDIVFVTMGLNDNFSMPARADEIRRAIADDLGRIRGALPDARMIVVEPFWYSDDRPASVDTIAAWVADEADAVGAERFAGASHWIEGHPEWMASDGLHPNDDGYAAMADRMNEALAELGL